MALLSILIEFTSKSFENLDVATLKKYLQKRGITANHHRKEIWWNWPNVLKNWIYPACVLRDRFTKQIGKNYISQQVIRFRCTSQTALIMQERFISIIPQTPFPTPSWRVLSPLQHVIFSSVRRIKFMIEKNPLSGKLVKEKEKTWTSGTNIKMHTLNIWF